MTKQDFRERMTRFVKQAKDGYAVTAEMLRNTAGAVRENDSTLAKMLEGNADGLDAIVTYIEHRLK